MIFQNFQNCAFCEKYLKDNLAPKIYLDICPWILSVPQSSQFSSSFAPGKLFACRNKECPRTISEHIFAPNGGYCLFTIQLSYTVRVPIFWLAALYHVILGCDETTTLRSLSGRNNRGVNSTHHCHYTMASADSNFVVSMQCLFVQCIHFE